MRSLRGAHLPFSGGRTRPERNSRRGPGVPRLGGRGRTAPRNPPPQCPDATTRRPMTTGTTPESDPGGPGTDLVPVEQEDLGELVGRIVSEAGADPKRRAGLVARLARALAGSARAAGVTSAAGGRWLAATFAEDRSEERRVGQERR